MSSGDQNLIPDQNIFLHLIRLVLPLATRLLSSKLTNGQGHQQNEEHYRSLTFEQINIEIYGLFHNIT